ncbi:hypothetical protein L7F22_032440 [Adiantum nelumboides]|nr:hypothetical protein [Adiantum nelumboides]
MHHTSGFQKHSLEKQSGAQFGKAVWNGVWNCIRTSAFQKRIWKHSSEIVPEYSLETHPNGHPCFSILAVAHKQCIKFIIQQLQCFAQRCQCLVTFLSILLKKPFPFLILQLKESDARAFTAFEQQRSRFGSVFAFHGTSAENLHSILRCGLLILSNSSLQRNGAIFGEGIYLSLDPAVAFGFSKAGIGWECSHFGQRARYLLLCEVALGEQVLSSKSSQVFSSKSDGNLGAYIIVKNCDLVKLRFIFLYVEPSSNNARPKICNEQHQLRGLQTESWGFQAKRINWCKVMIVFYALLLMGIAILNSHWPSKFYSKLHKTSRM